MTRASIIALLSSLAIVNGCVTASGGGGGNNGAVQIGNTGIPSSLPPTPAPTPPPPPPPIATGWVPAPPRQEVQDMTRQNCKKSVSFEATVDPTSSAEDPIRNVQEVFTYVCEYQVYVEVILFDESAPTDCACGFSYTRPLPPQDPNFERAYETNIKHFNLVVYDLANKKTIRIINEFQMDVSSNTTNVLRDSVEDGLLATLTAEGGSYHNFSSVTTGFAGKVDSISIDDYPELDLSKPENQNNVAAMCFTVQDLYKSSYRWPEPPMPIMGSYPNAYFTNCVPWHYPSAVGIAKRFPDSYPTQYYFYREFLLFPADSTLDLGDAPKARYITSYYADSSCSVDKGIVSFDREFDFSLSNDVKIHGAFLWERRYSNTNLIGGVPASIDTSASNVVGFNSVVWKERMTKESDYGQDSNPDNHAYIPGKLWHTLNGSDCDPEVDCNPTFNDNMGFAQSRQYWQLCEKIPEQWFTCTEISDTPNDDCGFTSDKYLENAIYFRANDALECREARGYRSDCDQETTLLSFQNLGNGADSRDYRKKAGSLLLTGLRDNFCEDSTSLEVFDTLVFYPYDADLGIGGKPEYAKRGIVQQKREFPKLNYKRQMDGIVYAPEEPAYGHPEAEQIIVKPGAGSANADGLASGDHPLVLFPESYTVPVSLDPSDLDYSSVQDGWLFDGAFAPCLAGTQGCSCRKREGRPSCDAPLVCSSEDGEGFCMDAPCEAGFPGCDCRSDDSCESGLECHAPTKSCAFVDVCTPGDLGCACVGGDKGSCSSDTASCYAGVCLAFDCPAGFPGCECMEGDACKLSTTSCSSGKCQYNDALTGEQDGKLGDKCNTQEECATAGSTCDTTAQTCVGVRCEAGSIGCRCAANPSDPEAVASVCDAGSCSAYGICLHDSCEEGSGGCQCYQGNSCAAGFECVNELAEGESLTGERNDRCVRERCDAGEPGCACDINLGASEACSIEGFACVNLLKTGSDYKCVATGTTCGNQVERCKKYCGEGNVLKCPGCENQIPICVSTVAASRMYGFSAVLFVLAAIVQLF